MDKKFKFYTDGIKTIKIKPNDKIPDGFYPGRTFKTNPWNKGLTADTDERVKLNGQATRETRLKNGSYVSWNKGLTKETDERVALNFEHYKQGMLRKYGVENPASRPGKVAWNKGLTKETDSRVEKISVSNKGRKLDKETIRKAKEKEYITKKQNGTLGNYKSSIEKELESELIKIFGAADITYSYFDIDRYPFKADFYIKSLDIFIELYGDPRHGDHPFDKNNEDDLKLLDELKNKNDSISKGLIYGWADLDVRKVECAIKNDLNFIAIYPKKKYSQDKDIVYTHWKQCEDVNNILSQISDLWQIQWRRIAVFFSQIAAFQARV